MPLFQGVKKLLDEVVDLELYLQTLVKMCCFSLTAPTSFLSSPLPLPSLLVFCFSKKVMLPTGAAFRWFQQDSSSTPYPKLCHQVQCQLLDSLRNRHWLINKQATNKIIEKNINKKQNNNNKKQSGNGCTYLFLEPKMKRKEKHLWQFSFPFLCFHFGTFCPFSSSFFFCRLNMELFIARNRNDRLSVDNQLISVFGVNVVHVWKDTVLVQRM